MTAVLDAGLPGMIDELEIELLGDSNGEYRELMTTTFESFRRRLRELH
jgi:hypothetical protein